MDFPFSVCVLNFHYEKETPNEIAPNLADGPALPRILLLPLVGENVFTTLVQMRESILFMFSSFNDAVSSSDSIESNGMMISE
jgi:hypothetical protein